MKRWFESRTIGVNVLAGVVNTLTALIMGLLSVAPQVLDVLPKLDLEPAMVAMITIGVNAFVNGANVWLRYQSPTAIGSADEIEAYTGAVDRSTSIKARL